MKGSGLQIASAQMIPKLRIGPAQAYGGYISEYKYRYLMFIIFKRYLIVAFLFLLLCPAILFSQDIYKLRIDPSQAYGGNISEYFDQVEYIPLETKKESLFGNIDQLIVTDESYIVYDWDTRSVLFFRPDGRFLERIKKPLNNQLSISYDSYRKIIILSIYNLSTQKTTIELYDPVGVLVKDQAESLKLSGESELTAFGNNYFLSQGNCYLAPGRPAKDSVCYLVNIYEGDRLYRSFLPYNQTKNPGVCSIQGYTRKIKIVGEGYFYIATPLDHIVYKISKDSAEKMFQFVFPSKRTLGKEVYTSRDRRYIDSVRRTIDNDQNIIMDVSNIFYNRKYLFFKINTRVYASYLGSDINNQYNFLFDTTSGKLVSIERMLPDKRCFYLPIADNGLKISGLNYYKQNFYTALSSLTMFTEMEKTKDKNPQYPSVLQEYFKSQHRKSNPVIVKMKLKG
ncbi:hypothetical protein A3860_33040 [Niastella vici]|uniref:6-bladed beta-propeller n=1 Tax=Niastella vici TaxID=1703345 RepID=A0A1V9FQ60_9BACT|nr:6-bladed beta-propeller [Niastella vici]OQP60494.1 hypothetical protein A3860_33040 [Niastella vici]